MLNNFTRPAAVELRRLTKLYREGQSERVVFRDVDVSIRPGEIAVLVGRSGSGKSTLLNLISGIDLPTSGSVSVDGVDITALSERDRTLFRRKHVGFIFQLFNLIPLLNVEENLLLPPVVRPGGMGLDAIFGLFPNLSLIHI